MKRMILKILKPQYFSTAAVVLCLVNIYYCSFWISTVINILLLIAVIALVINDMTTNSRISHQWTKTMVKNFYLEMLPYNIQAAIATSDLDEDVKDICWNIIDAEHQEVIEMIRELEDGEQ